ncbi:VOC family protein [Tessaracoccus rhinocerotis]|uniref:VOC family protein n=1 Tax=Tessaracoccus rhinocerotis TaxID=1689449 RepID=A0A553JYX1_9ACTN|nr:VOC family protein [Tessaracoccus rhinocerotis]TRY17650.1 VOC family protein [Tessaracoccus rhinocerotis]
MSQLDHIAIAGPDLDALVAQFHDLTGVQPVKGGHHEGQGTANYLVGLGEGSYIELIGPDPDRPDPDQPRPLRVDEVTETTVTGWAARPDDLDALVASAREVGHDPGAVIDMDRRTPGGELVAWRLTPPTGAFDGVVPFLIDWLDTAHPSDGLPQVRLRSLTITHPDVDGVRAALASVEALDPVSAVKPGAAGIAVELDTPKGRVRIG